MKRLLMDTKVIDGYKGYWLVNLIKTGGCPFLIKLNFMIETLFQEK